MINLSTGFEHPQRGTPALLVGGAAAQQVERVTTREEKR